ncbi:MAG: RNA polymerase factor sigma-54 [Rhizobiales bacterium]|nr:RNA polymerase factor sigma-54 [Hyphomicrobiales bacterium]
MAISQKLEMRTSQGLVMTPQLMQAIKLLQLSNLDLVAFVEAELERNPLLEREEGAEAERGDGPQPETAAEDFSDDGDSGSSSSGDDWMEDRYESRAAMEEQLGTNLENVFPDDAPSAPAEATPAAQEPAAYSEWASVGSGGRAEDDYNLEAFVSAEVTLPEHLSRQLSLSPLDPVQRLIGQHLIDSVDEAGYLRGDLEGMAEKLGAPRGQIESVLSEIQTFDPPGVGARDLAECLAIQLRERNRLDPAMKTLIDNLDLLAKRDFAQLRKLSNVDEEDLADMIAELRRLNPKPGLVFGGGVVQPIVPDVFVRPASDGGWNVELNSDTLPRVLVNQTYYSRVSKSPISDKEKAFLTECMQTATWLTRSLDQRARTILKVATEIVRQQDAFLVQGVQHLRPLNLRMVADAIQMHESTVSRVTANKYMATPRGIFELKYFFSSSIASSEGGEAHSSEAVRDRIKRLIDEESPDDILSDDTIVTKLKDAGIDIARRTVAKYREALRIPSSVQRRREKRSSPVSN